MLLEVQGFSGTESFGTFGALSWRCKWWDPKTLNPLLNPRL